ncbi:TonB-dependent receptor [Alkalitalea saponilacus]|uniref:Outer membrane receptor proteins, mostly Fe transport n=1 Tax=Alkalitalea saponilacus TaxID=889453 RepID=A0A1T5HSD0_9BACT|nr:TonB-dependent receptor [Alkalitalea saponilacus]ASB50054.1 TonB-dependent receptor [Alkalitalea saponilacus]SKC23430.1 Outer membrane receptor proteins, mostly Fe transport [Alkalitalea saponilacus]
MKHLNSFLILILLVLATNAMEAQAPSQSVRGTVTDAVSGEPLVGATVYIPTLEKGTTTNINGEFVLSHIPVGRHRLEAGFLGYNPVVFPELLVTSGRETIITIHLHESVSQLSEVTIRPTISKDKPLNSMATVSARTFSVEEARRYAGGMDDPARMAASFAGITTSGINNNAIIVRGNAPKGLLWRLEGVDIPGPNHYSGSNVAGGGGISIFSSQLLTNSDFYTGAFPAEYGNAASGVFDMKLRSGNNRKKEYAAQIGIQGLEFAAEGPFTDGGQSSFLFNYRYSTLGLIFQFLPETKDGTELPIYQDLSFKLNLPAGNAGVFSFWGIGGLSESTSKGFDDPDKWEFSHQREKMRFDYNMGATGISHQKSFGTNTHIRTTMAANASQYIYKEEVRLDDNNPENLTPNHHIDNVEGKITLSSVINQKYGARMHLRGGITTNRLFYRLRGDAMDYDNDMYGRFLDGDGIAWLLQTFLQTKYHISSSVALTTGIHASWFDLNGEFLAEPRFALEWQTNQSHRFSAGFGLHSQTEMLSIYYAQPTNQSETYPNKKLKRQKAQHYVLGYDWNITDNLRFKLEPYFQYLYDVPVIENTSYSMLNFRSDWTFNKTLINDGTGTNRGIDITLERFLKDGYFYMTTASIYKSSYKDADGISRRTRYDGGYAVNLLGGREFLINNKNLLGISLRFTFMGPEWYQKPDLEKTTEQGNIVYDELSPFNYRHSSMETATDMTITYRVNKERRSAIWALQIKNLLGRQFEGMAYNLKTGEIENEFFTSMVPFLSYKLEF